MALAALVATGAAATGAATTGAGTASTLAGLAFEALPFDEADFVEAALAPPFDTFLTLTTAASSACWCSYSSLNSMLRRSAHSVRATFFTTLSCL